MKKRKRVSGNVYCLFFSILLFGTVNFMPVPASGAAWWEYASPKPFRMGFKHTTALKKDGSLWSWGLNSSGQLGLGYFSWIESFPRRAGGDEDWWQIETGLYCSFGLKKDGTLWAWGPNSGGQLGLGADVVARNSPAQVGTDSDWVQISSGYSHTLGIKSDGTLWAWGWNHQGQVGQGSIIQEHYYEPVQIGCDTDWLTTAAGDYHSLALKTDATLWVWGYSAGPEPAQVGSDTDWVEIDAGYNFSVARKSNNTLWAWGYNDKGQLGSGDTVMRGFPTKVGSDGNWVRVAAGYKHVLAVKSDRTLWSWGLNDAGQLGREDVGEYSFTPARIGSDEDWAAVDAEWASAALKENGSLWVWGKNENGQLGLDDTIDRSSPVYLINLLNLKPVANAGAPLALGGPGIVILNGTSSYDPDGDPISFRWFFSSLPPASEASLIESETAKPSFYADVLGTYIVTLVVGDGWETDTASVAVSFNNLQPVADAGLPQSATVGQAVFLDGSGSYDADSGPLTYRWTLSTPAGSEAFLSTADAPIASFLVDQPGEYIGRLVVNDGLVDSVTDETKVTAITREDAAVQILKSTQDDIKELSAEKLKSEKMKNPLVEKMSETIEMIDSGKQMLAAEKIHNDLIKKMDGCSSLGIPDKGDWIIDCDAQKHLHDKEIEVLELIENY